MRIDRDKIFNKYDGRCAYCGCELKKRWQVDHIHPQFLAHHEPDKDNNRESNLNPSCPKCNLFKHSFRLEDYRRELSLQVSRLKRNAQFNRALTFGQIEITEKPIVFYFENHLPKGEA